MKTIQCAMCGATVRVKTKPPKTCRRCRDAYKLCLRRNREECRAAAELVAEALAALRKRAGDLAPTTQRELAHALGRLRDPETWQPTEEQIAARRAKVVPQRPGVLLELVGETSSTGRPPGGSNR